MSLELLSAGGGGEVVPRYFLAHDYRWLSALIAEVARFEGKRAGELVARLKEPLSVAAPHDKLRFASTVVAELHGRVPSALCPRRVRRVVFGASRCHSHADALALAAAELDASSGDIAEALFADVPAQKRLGPPKAELSPQLVALECNRLLVTSLMRRAVGVRVIAEGQVRPLVRQAKWRGLLCTVSAPVARGASEIAISGPYALFRRTTMYGRALGSLVPELASCHRVEMRAELRLDGGGGDKTLVIRSGDPILPPVPRREHDSAVERRFARDFGRAAPAWDVVREPAAIAAKDTLIFPDFLLRDRRCPARTFFVEIVGFWTPQYLTQKLARLRAASLKNLILCVDETLNCGEDDLPSEAALVRYRRAVAPDAVLAAMARLEARSSRTDARG